MAVKLGDLYSNLDLEYSGFLTGLKKSVDASASASSKIEGHLNTIKTGAQALFAGALITQTIQIGKRALDYASSLDEVSQQLGVTARDLQVYRYAASQVGISQEEMDKGLQKFTRTLGEAKAGNSGAIGTFRELGVSLDDLKKGDSHTVLLKTADGLAQIKDSANRAAPEVALFGRAGQQLDTLLSGGSAAIRELAKAAEDLGLVLSRDEIENADKTADKLSELKQVLEAKIAKTVAENADAIFYLAEAAEKAADKVGLLVSNLRVYFAQRRSNSAESQIQADEASGLDKTDPKAYRAHLVAARDAARDASKAAGARLPHEDEDTPTPQGGRHYTDPAALAAAAAAARRAQQERAKEAERQRQVTAQNARLDQTYLDSLSSLTSDTVERATLERDKLASESKANLEELNEQVAAGKVTAAEAKGLRLKIERNAAIEADGINQRENVALEQESLAVATSRLSTEREELSDREGLARTAAERRQLELKILAAARAAEERQLKPILDDANRKDGEHHYSQGERDQAALRASQLDTLYAGKTAALLKSTAGPGEQYLNGLISSAGEAQEALESVKVDGLKGLEDGLAGAIAGTEKLGDVFEHVGQQIIASLAKIALEKAVIGPLASRLFGSTAITSELGSFENGSPLTSVGALSTSIDTASLPHFATGGGFSVGGLGGTDSQLVQFMATPGEMVNISKGEPASQRGMQLLVTPSKYFDVRVAETAAPMAANAAASGALGGSQLAEANSARRAARRMR